MQIHSNIKAESLIVRIDAILPQTQCEKCGYPGCKPYATAIVNGEADINQCPPGGDAGIRALANLTHQQYKPLNPKNGLEKPKALAVIDEATCIGCTLCIQACPVDAILGASKQMHTVIAMECTGCELCVAPCPVDCITMQEDISHDWSLNYPVITSDKAKAVADLARKRYDFRLSRIERDKVELMQKHAERTAISKVESAKQSIKKSAVATAIERAKLLKIASQILTNIAKD
ncbi:MULTISPECIES: electron transport complex subunit RsxB [Methylotenera]|uniref:electron transport complex subunit RsxB n=1 Tax=Methylotenera TaxID=359407 RepID=UPI000366883C|nr:MULTISPECIES: electron transport complex subunit RsxB [Methylotenera]